MKVRVYPEKTIEEFGAIRWQVEWQEVTPEALVRNKDGDADFDLDSDLVTLRKYYKTEEGAMRGAREVHKRRHDWLAFGTIYVQKQAVDWFVEEDRVAEWTDVGEPSYID